MIFSLTPLGLIKYLYLRFTRKEIFFEGRCIQCGNCCKHIYLIDSWGKVISKEKQFKKLIEDDNAYSRFEVVENEGNALVFKCNWQKEDGTCGDHENRLPLCRRYPNEIMYFTNFELGDHCGYTLKTGKSFKNAFEKKIYECEAGIDSEPLKYDEDFDFLENPTPADENFDLDSISSDEEDKAEL